MYLFNRTKNCSVKQLDNDFLAQATFLDTSHELVMEIVVEASELIIKEINLHIIRIPHEECRQIQGKIKSLKGVAIKSGLTQLAKEKLGGPGGCAHVTDLFLEGAKALIQGRYHWRFLNMDEEEWNNIHSQELRGTCYHFSQVTNLPNKKEDFK